MKSITLQDFMKQDMSRDIRDIEDAQNCTVRGCHLHWELKRHLIKKGCKGGNSETTSS